MSTDYDEQRSASTESAQTRALCRALEKCGALTFAVVGSTMQRAGWPDRWILHRDWTGWLEFKAHDGSVSAVQRTTLAGMNDRRPGTAYVVRFGPPGKPLLGRVETENSDVLSPWTGDARELLETLSRLTREVSIDV